MEQGEREMKKRVKKSISSDEEVARTRSEKKKLEIQTKCPDLKGECGEYHEFLIKFSARVFFRDVEWIHVW